MQICRRPGSTDVEGFPLASSGSTGPQRTASLVLPDSPLERAPSPLERAPSTGRRASETA